MATVTNQLNSGTTPLSVLSGGTGVNTLTTAYAPVCAGTTATGALQPASTGLSSSGFCLTSNGASALPSFQAFPVTVTKLSVNLTALNLTSMYTTPVQILAAQGAHKLIVVHAAAIEYIFNTTSFTGGSSNGPILQYGNTQHAGGTLIFASALDITTNVSKVSYGPVNGLAVSSFTDIALVSGTGTSMVNNAIYVTNDTAPYALGNSTARVTIYYSVLTTTI